MADAIRTRDGLRAGPQRGRFVLALLPSMLSYFTMAEARADILDNLLHRGQRALAFYDQHEIAALALTVGAVVFAVLTAISFVRIRRSAAAAAAAARSEIASLKAELDRLSGLMHADPQLIVMWTPGESEPEIIGDVSALTGSSAPRRALAFGTWLDADHAQAIENALERLRMHGESFFIPLTTLSGRQAEADGRALGGRATLRIRNVSGATRDLAELAIRHEKLLRDVDALRALIEALPSPIWARDANGRLAWVNKAYALAVDAADNSQAVAQGIELLGSAAREQRREAHSQQRPFAAHLPVIVAGQRRMYDVFDLPTRNGSAGVGIDVSELENLRLEIGRLIDTHRRTLDQLPTAVATFGGDRRLVFYNAAYCSLWGFSAAALDQKPTDSQLLDLLRATRKLPEQVNFRQWAAQLHDAYRSLEPREHQWHLPDGRTLRVVTTPNPEGGVTYLFDDVTERLDLERRYDALIRVQGETLDHLAEAVAVFGSDGRLRLHNPAFVRMWKLSPAMVEGRPHIDALINLCAPVSATGAAWEALRGAITALDERQAVSGRFERRDGTVIDCATVPLPDGATLLTFQDVTDTVNVERVLRERNEALERADQLKNDFVHHVSYELRSPLTNIIGFAQLLDDRATGPLNAKQLQYLSYINSSSSVLLAIIDDILDLATIDAGAMTLDLGAVDIPRAVQSAADGVKERLAEKGMSVELLLAADIGSFMADERRIRQVLYNLLSNAIGFSPREGTITLSAERRDDAIVISVTDRGPGIPEAIIDRVFHRFETHALGSQHRGAGLGLSIVRSFVELHGGQVKIDSAVGRGTTVHCIFPLHQAAGRVAAE